MASASFQFVLFGVVAAILSNLSRSPRWRSTVPLAASLVFLSLLTPGWTQLLPLACFLALGYVCIVLVRRNRGGGVGLCACTVVIAYVWLRKYTFLPSSIFLAAPYLALGLSYILFRVLHLIIEVASETTAPKLGLGAYVTYTLNFTTFISGPIQRYGAFGEDLWAPEPVELNLDIVAAQIERIIRGYFKVNVLALLLDILHHDALTELAQPGPASAKAFAAIRVVALYPLFLYANFSGYIDIVIALARLMRIRLPENFDRPFASSSFLDFWSHWHITLSTWLKTYVYNPLVVNLCRKWPSPSLQPSFAVLSMFVTFFLIGIWHGRTSEFTVYGLLSGAGVAINLAWQLWLTRQFGRKTYRALAGRPTYEAVARGLTFTWYAFTLCWFWADWGQLKTAYMALGTLGWLAAAGALWVASTLLLAGWEWMRALLLRIRTGGVQVVTSRYARAAWATTLVFVWFFITLVISEPAPDIVYKAF